MQFKAILFLVVIGAVAVLAKKGSSSSEEDRNGYETLQVWPHHHPGRGPRPFRFRGPKHQIVVMRPQYQQPHYPPVPQPPQGPHGPQYPEQERINPYEVHQYLQNVQKQMQDFSAKAYKEFQAIENEIDRNRKHMEETMKSQFQTLELALEAKQAKEIQQAIKDGKDELKIQECLAEEEQEMRADMDADIQRTTDCINDATERARKVLTDARNSYTETSIESSMQAREWAQKMRVCAEQGNAQCVREGAVLISEKTKDTVQQGSQYFENIKEAPQRQMVQMDYCRQNFMDDLADMKLSYSNMVRRCVIASEIQEPEEGDDEEEEEEKPNVNVNVQVKPEDETEAETEVQVQA